jgi:hypothetical protein
MVSLPQKKKTKYLAAIMEWLARSTHTLHDVQKLYGKLLHSSLVVPAGRARLTGFEAMLGIYGDRPLMPRHPPASIRQDLQWWVDRLSRPFLGRTIPIPIAPCDLAAFSDASSGIGIGIVLAGRWRAWRLIPGWKTLKGAKDIGWAEAVGFELLVYAVSRTPTAERNFVLYGDNQGIIDGWRNNRSRNAATNDTFKRIHDFLELPGSPTSIQCTYVPSEDNPADGPSRGIYPPEELLLDPISLPPGLSQFLIDATMPLSDLESQLLRQGCYPKPAAKVLAAVRDRHRQQEQHQSELFREQLLEFKPFQLV